MDTCGYVPYQCCPYPEGHSSDHGYSNYKTSRIASATIQALAFFFMYAPPLASFVKSLG
jgi:hypothetical protein